MVRAIVVLAAVGCCLGGVAYAATHSAGREDGGNRTPLQPRFIAHPEAVTTERVAEFDFAQPARPAAKIRPGLPLLYECRLDERPWEACEAPVTLQGIKYGTHRFSVRAVNRSGTEGPVATFEWLRTRAPKPVTEAPASAEASAPPAQQPSEQPVVPPVNPPVEPVEPPVTGMPFKIEQVGNLEDLFPGAPAQTIEVRIVNPNPVPISVISLTAAIATDPPGCPATENFVLTPAGVDPETPLVVAAESTATLPAEGIAGPTIGMLELPVSQDACQAAELTIALSGEASG